MSIWLCDTCVVDRIKKGECKPLGAYYPPNRIPFRCGDCDDCGSTEQIQKVPLDLTPKIDKKKCPKCGGGGV